MGQVEILFTLLFSRFYLGETPSRGEIGGALVLVLGVLPRDRRDRSERLPLLAGEQRQIITKTRARQHQMAMLRWGSDYIDPHSNAETFNVNTDNSDAQKNRTLAWRSNWKDDEFTRRALEALKEPDTDRRAVAYERLQRDHQERSPFVFLQQQIEVAAMRGGVSGLELAFIADRTRYAGLTKA